MSYRIALNFEDGATRIVECKEGEKVLDAAYRQKVNLPMDCSDGVCGTCKCRCEQGEYDLGDDYIDDALTADEADEGLILTCQMVPSSDCVIQVPVPSTACKIVPVEHAATVKTVELASEDTIILTLTLDNPEALAFLPGQYVNLFVPGTEEHRSYSFSSKPGTAEASFVIRNVPDGLMSGWLVNKAQPGDRMRFVGPNGSFFLRSATRPVLMLAGGTGLAPILSILEVLADQGTDQPIHLVYGVSFEKGLVELKRLNSFAERLPRFSYATCVSHPESENVLKGHVTDHIGDEYFHGGNVDVYLCGPPPMVEAVRGTLRNRGVAPVNFYYEKFASTEAVPA